MNRQIQLVLAGSLVVIALTAWLAFPVKARTDPSKFRYMHCPECKRESIYSPTGYDKPCMYCEKSLVGTVESVKLTGGSNPYSLIIVSIFIEVIVTMGAICYLGRKRLEQNQEPYFYFNCERCRQKLAYREHQAGLTAMCRRCRQPFIYPEASHTEYVE